MKRGAEAFVKQSQAPVRCDTARESVGLLEPMSTSAEQGLAEQPAQPSPGYQLAVKPEGRELPWLGDSDQCPQQVSPGELGVGAGSEAGGQTCRWMGLHGCGRGSSPCTSSGGYWCQ